MLKYLKDLEWIPIFRMAVLEGVIIMYYLRREKRSFGPFSIQEISELLNSGSINRDTEIAPVGTDEWQTIREIGLFGNNQEIGYVP
jgi:hypothetical protein